MIDNRTTQELKLCAADDEPDPDGLYNNLAMPCPPDSPFIRIRIYSRLFAPDSPCRTDPIIF